MAKRIRRKVVNPATKYRMSLAHKGSRNGMFGKHHTKQTKEKISQKLIEYWNSLPDESPL